MTTKPTAFPDFAMLDQTGPKYAKNNVYEPPLAWKNYGWSEDEVPPRNYFNWLHRTTSNWLHHFDEKCIRPATYVVAASNASQNSKDLADAVCDGTADDVDINAAIAVCTSGGTVVLSEGTFYLAAHIAMADNIRLVGQGAGATILALDTGTATDRELIYASSKADISVEEMSLDCTFALGASAGISLVSCTRVALRGLKIDAAHIDTAVGGYGMDLGGSWMCVDRCYVTNCDSWGIKVQGDRVIVSRCEAGGCLGDGFQVTGNRCTLDRCVADANEGAGIEIIGDYNLVLECRAASQVANDGIVLYGSTGSKVQGGESEANGHNGVTVSGCADCVVDGVRSEGNSQTTTETWSNIYITGGSNNAIRNCTIRPGGETNVPNYGIEFDSGTATAYCIAAGNDLRGMDSGHRCSAIPAGAYSSTPQYVWDGANHKKDDIDAFYLTNLSS